MAGTASVRKLEPPIVNQTVFVLLSFLVGAALGFITGSTATKNASEPEVARLSDDFARESSLSELRALLVEFLDHSIVEPPSRTTDPDSRQPVAPSPGIGDDSFSELTVSLRELQELVRSTVEVVAQAREALVASHEKANFPALELLERYSPTPNWDALQALFEAYRERGSNNLASSFLLNELRWTSQESLLARFGRPSRIGDDGTWTYAREQAIPGSPNTVQFSFVSSYVMGLRIF